MRGRAASHAPSHWPSRFRLVPSPARSRRDLTAMRAEDSRVAALSFAVSSLLCDRAASCEHCSPSLPSSSSPCTSASPPRAHDCHSTARQLTRMAALDELSSWVCASSPHAPLLGGPIVLPVASPAAAVPPSVPSPLHASSSPNRVHSDGARCDNDDRRATGPAHVGDDCAGAGSGGMESPPSRGASTASASARPVGCGASTDDVIHGASLAICVPGAVLRMLQEARGGGGGGGGAASKDTSPSGYRRAAATDGDTTDLAELDTKVMDTYLCA